jgi:hypothetical protein
MEEFKIALVDALEHISAFSLNNHEWRKIFEGKGLAPIPYAEWSKGRPAKLIEEVRGDLWEAVYQALFPKACTQFLTSPPPFFAHSFTTRSSKRTLNSTAECAMQRVHGDVRRPPPIITGGLPGSYLPYIYTYEAYCPLFFCLIAARYSLVFFVILPFSPAKISTFFLKDTPLCPYHYHYD